MNEEEFYKRIKEIELNALTEAKLNTINIINNFCNKRDTNFFELMLCLTLCLTSIFFNQKVILVISSIGSIYFLYSYFKLKCFINVRKEYLKEINLRIEKQNGQTQN